MAKRRVGQIFKERRKELGLSMHQVAELSGVSPPTISRIERGTAKITRRANDSLCLALRLNPHMHIPLSATEALRIAAEIEEKAREWRVYAYSERLRAEAKYREHKERTQ